MQKFVSRDEVHSFLSRVQQNFPNFVAGVICDEHGFPIGAKVPKNFHIKENQMALSALTDNEDFINDPKYMKVKRSIGSNNVKLFMLLEKTNKYIHRFKSFKKILKRQRLF